MSRNIILLSLISFFNDIASEMIYPLIPLLVSSLGYGAFYVGFLEGLSEFLLAICQSFFGYLSDFKKKRKIFIQTGYLFSVLSKPLYMLWRNPLWVLFCRLLDRLGKGIRTAARDALLAENAQKENFGKVFGFHRAMDTGGAIVGPLMGLFLSFYFSFGLNELFLWAALPGFFALALTFFVKEKKVIEKNSMNLDFKKIFFYYQNAHKFLRRLLISFWILSIVQGSLFFIFLWLQNLGNSKEKILGGYLVYNLVYGLLAFPSGFLADLYGPRKIFFSGGFFFLVSYLLFIFLPNDLGFYLGFFFYGLFSALTTGVKKAWFSLYLAKDDKATGFGFLAMGDSLAFLLGQSILGFLWDTFGAKFSLFSSLFGVLLSLGMSFLLTKNLPTK